jgi:hypothetical protein
MTVENPHAGQGSVMLDIGGDVGALVVTMPPELEGVGGGDQSHRHRSRGPPHAPHS